MSSAKITSIQCPQCKAPLKTHEMFQTCDYCGAYIIIDIANHFQEKKEVAINTSDDSYFFNAKYNNW